MKKNKLILLIGFIVVGVLASQVAFNNIAGSKVSFTLFDFFAPVAAALLGGPIGILAVIGVGLINLFTNDAYTFATMFRIIPTLFAVYYFGLSIEKRQSKWLMAIPLGAMIAFWLHPNGREAWYYALFWLIPVVAYFKRDWLFVRSLGSTFMAHAVGGAVWIWAFGLPAEVWIALIPLVMIERLMFAGGISIAYLAANNLASLFSGKKWITQGVKVEEKYRYVG